MESGIPAAFSRRMRAMRNGLAAQEMALRVPIANGPIPTTSSREGGGSPKGPAGMRCAVRISPGERSGYALQRGHEGVKGPSNQNQGEFEMTREEAIRYVRESGRVLSDEDGNEDPDSLEAEVQFALEDHDAD